MDRVLSWIEREKAMRILFVTTEVYPLVKTGGLADVAGALSAALAESGEDVRLLLPAYPQAMRALLHGRPIGTGEVLGWRIHLIEGCMPDSGVPVLLVVCPLLFERLCSSRRVGRKRMEGRGVESRCCPRK